MKFRDGEQVLLNNGWIFKNAKGSHYQYVHPTKPGKVTVPHHNGDIAPVIIKAIMKQAGL